MPSPAPQEGTGNPEPSTRDQFIAAAEEHFRKYGYGKTTLADLSKAIGFSKTYVYRYFKSKQAIGEAICSQCLDGILEDAAAAITGASSYSDKLRKMFQTLTAQSSQLFFNERKLYDIAAVSVTDGWESSTRYQLQLSEMLRAIIAAGREAGEFERKTPLDEATRAILLAQQPFIDPRALQYNLDLIPEQSNEVVAMILRSLAP